MRLPTYVYETIHEAGYADALDLDRMVKGQIEQRPQSFEDARRLSENTSRLSGVRHFFRGYAPRDFLCRVAAEFRSLSETERRALPSDRQGVIGLVTGPHAGAQNPLHAYLHQQNAIGHRRRAFEQLGRPNEAGASELRQRALHESVQILRQRWALRLTPEVVLRRIQDHVRECRLPALDVPNRFGHSPRDKALHALGTLHAEASGAGGLSFFVDDNELSKVGLAALAWQGIESHRPPKTPDMLRQDLVFALSRCLDDEHESSASMPGPTCGRGWREHLCLLFSGHGYNLPIERVYNESPRHLEMMYELAPAYNERFDGDIPSAADARAFHIDALDRSRALIEEADPGAGSAARRATEMNKAILALDTLCAQMNWPKPTTQTRSPYISRNQEGAL